MNIWNLAIDVIVALNNTCNWVLSALTDPIITIGDASISLLYLIGAGVGIYVVLMLVKKFIPFL